MAGDKLYEDINLVQFYDYDNPWFESFDIIDSWIKENDTVLDIGCGTGTLAAFLSEKCPDVYGIDISSEMLKIAIEKSAKVKWIEGDATNFKLNRQFDFIFLSGHSFQTLLNDEDRLALLRNIKDHLRIDGTFVFDTRNPLVQEWKTWTPLESIRYFKHPSHGIMKSWNDYTVNDKIICYKTFYQVLHSDLIWKADSRIDFPTKDQVLSLIEQAGLITKELYGDWRLSKFCEESEEMIFYGTVASP